MYQRCVVSTGGVPSGIVPSVRTMPCSEPSIWAPSVLPPTMPPVVASMSVLPQFASQTTPLGSAWSPV